MTDTLPAPAATTLDATPRTIYVHRLRISPNTIAGPTEYFAAYELTPAGLEVVWPENGTDGAKAIRPDAMEYHGTRDELPPFVFALDGGGYDKPHAVAESIARFWGEPVRFGLLTGHTPGLRNVSPNR